MSSPQKIGGNVDASDTLKMSEHEFKLIQKWLFQTSGIDLAPTKSVMVASRLAKRVREYQLASYGEYFHMVIKGSNPREKQLMLDLLTTNETYFFREPAHFDFLKNEILAHHPMGTPFRLWCGASSTGQEPYSLAMCLAERFGVSPWEVFSSDISARVLETARQGHYSMQRTEGMPTEFMKKYCLKGTGKYEGTLLVSKKLRDRCQFDLINLNEPLPDIGEFDVIFLRNVLIYFNNEIKKKVVMRMVEKLKQGGYFICGHSESIKGYSDKLENLKPTIYRKL